MFSYEDIFKDLKRILFVVAHPDDLDVYFGGLVARLVNDKKEVNILLATSGDKGAEDAITEEKALADERIKEQVAALEVLGLTKESLQLLNLPDGELQENMSELLEKITKTIRKLKPDIICTLDPQIIYSYSNKLSGYFINHRDHRAVGLAAIDATYPLARSHSFFKGHFNEGLSPHSTFKLYVTSDQYPEANTNIDITSVIEKKSKAMAQHKSQFTPDQVDQIIQEDNKVEDSYTERGKFINLLY